jgi:hypothetical protein
VQGASCLGKDLTPGLIAILFLALPACGSGSSSSAGDGSATSKDSSANSTDRAEQESGEHQDVSDSGQSNTSADAAVDTQVNDSNLLTDSAADAAPVLDGLVNFDVGDTSAVTAQYSCTFNATGAYPLGTEHRGFVIFGTVVDTTAGAGRARVGAFQNALDSADMIKFVWPGILTANHTFEIALFEDHAKNRTCSGDANSTEPQWLFPVPPVKGDYTFNFTHNPRATSCQDFPTGPIPP